MRQEEMQLRTSVIEVSQAPLNPRMGSQKDWLAFITVVEAYLAQRMYALASNGSLLDTPENAKASRNLNKALVGKIH